MKKKYVIGMGIVLMIVVSSLGFYFLRKNIKSKQAPKIQTYTVPSLEKVFINGVIAPKDVESIYLDATKGTVDKVYVKDGEKVEKDDTLFRYKNAQVSEQIDQVELQLESSKKQKEQFSQQGESMRTQGNPIGNNMSSAKGATSSIDEQIKLYEKQISSLKEKEYYTVKAPISGKVILDDDAKVGTTPYITIENTLFYVKGNVSEKDQPKLKQKQVVDVNVLAINTNIKGKISLVGNRPVHAVANTTNAIGGASSNLSHYEVNIDLNSQKNLTNGFHVQAIVKLSTKGMEIPKTAILKDGKTEYVYKVIDNKLKKQVITYSKGKSDKVIVNSGLKEEEKIVQNPTSEMKEGMKVE